MVFPWHVPAQNDSVRAANPAWRNDMQRREVQTRAALLFRLGRQRDDAVATLRRYVAWEFEGRTVPVALEDLGAIVDAVYARLTPSTR